MNVISRINYRIRFFILFCFHLLWGLGLWWSISVYGLGTSRDSVEYLFTSQNLVLGNGFVSFSGQPYIFWPPLYPLLLSFLQILGVHDLLKAAFVLQIATFLWLAVLLAWLFLRVFGNNFAFAFLGNALVVTNIALTTLFQGVGSDYLFLALILSFIYLCDLYIINSQPKTLWLLTLVAALAMLQRYIGVVTLLCGAWIIYRYPLLTVVEKIKRLAVFSLSIFPLGMWILSLPKDAVVRDSPSSVLENVHQFTVSLLSWFLPSSHLEGHPVRLQFGVLGVWFIVFAGVFFLWKFKDKNSTNKTIEFSVFLFGFVYTVVLILLASLSSFNTLDSRFVSPVLVPLVIFVLVAIDSLMKKLEMLQKRNIVFTVKVSFFLVLFVMLGLTTHQSVLAMQTHHKSGWGYTSAIWNTHPVIAYWKRNHPAKPYLIFSNYPAGVALHIGSEVLPSPRKAEHPNTGEEIIPLDTYISELIIPGRETYLIWIEPNEYTHVYTVNDLMKIVDVETIYETNEGGIYRLLSR